MEQIRLKKSRIGTRLCFFSSTIAPGNNGSVPAFVILDQLNAPISIRVISNNVMDWRNEDNSFFEINPPLQNHTIISGAAIFNSLTYEISEQRLASIRNNWSLQNLSNSDGTSFSYVFHQVEEVDDMFADVYLHRTYETLDTIDIFNNLVNEIPQQQSNTGTVFGKLLAIQKIKDINNRNVKIPLKNVQVGIFNPSSEFPDINSLDENGNRLGFNFSENSTAQQYFNLQSFTADTQNYLLSSDEISNVPDHYKYVTTTNENGEFIIHNVPIGNKTLFFEVDLFKQGLTKDEIALNFFPFPSDNSPNTYEVPSIFFRQIPIDVVSNWGTLQTGYTEVNVEIAMDLRKWATFFVEQISFDNISFEEMQRKGYFSPLTIEIRNMSLDGFPKSKVQLVEIEDMLDRDEEHYLCWNNEIVQLKTKAEIRTSGYHAFKVPANMYDPNGFSTDIYGIPSQKKGVWLAGYQFNMYYGSSQNATRATGLLKTILDNGTYVVRDHFNLNIGDISNDQGPENAIGAFPYERKWDHTYPERYSIPRVPTIQNEYFNTLNADGKRILERPRFKDGDLVGLPFHRFEQESATGGYGAAQDNTNGSWFKTDFSKFVTRNFLYKYEKSVSIHDSYSNGYRPNDQNFQIDPLISSVLNGEKYQRVECGYGYWLRPEGWPRVAYYSNNGGSESIYRFDTMNPNSMVVPSMTNIPTEPIYSISEHLNSFSYLNDESGKKLSLNLGNQASIKKGGIDIYRIVDPSPQNLNSPDPTIIETFTDLYFQKMYFNRGIPADRVKINLSSANNGGQEKFWPPMSDVAISSMSSMLLNIKNAGSIPVEIFGIRLEVGSSFNFNAYMFSQSGVYDDLVLRLPANFNFNYDEFKYDSIRYEIEFVNIQLYRPGQGGLGAPEGPSFNRRLDIVQLPAFSIDNVPRYYLTTILTNVNRPQDGRGTAYIQGGAFTHPQQREGRGDHLFAMRFRDQLPWVYANDMPYYAE